jgi:hypothetical protein
VTAEFNLLEMTLQPSGLAGTEFGSTGRVDKSRILLDGVLWVEGGDFGPVLAEVPGKFTLGKAATSIHVEIGIDKSSLVLVEVTGAPFERVVPAAQQLKHRLYAHLKGALDALTAMPATPIDSAQHSGSLPALDWPDLVGGPNLATQHMGRSHVLMAFPGLEPRVETEIAQDTLDIRLLRYIEWIERIPRIATTNLQLWHDQDHSETILRLTQPMPPHLVTGARCLRDAFTGIVIEDSSEATAQMARSLHALQRLIILVRCFEAVWHGTKPRLTVEIVFEEPPISYGYRLTMERDCWGIPLARLALGLAKRGEVVPLFQTFGEDS